MTELDRITQVYYGKIKDIIFNHEDFFPRLSGAFVISTFYHSQEKEILK
jgi:hypothetical protein